MTRRLVALALPVTLALLAACGSGDNTSPTLSSSARTATLTTSPAAPTASPTQTDDSSVGALDPLCALLHPRVILQVTGFSAQLVQPHNGPGFLHFCTMYLDVPGCDMQCALSLEDLGTVDPNSNNDASAFRETLAAANPEAKIKFQDDVVGSESWLGTATAGDLPGFKVLYFNIGNVAYDLSSPRAQSGTLTADQMIALANAIVSAAP
jgi:hypothetical protein